MAVYVYSLASSDIVAELPGVSSENISATSQPLNTGDLTQFIEDGAGKLNSVLIARGITPSASMDETDHAALVEAVKSYAVAKALNVLGALGPMYEQAQERWQSVYAEYSNRPQNLGGSFASLTTVETDSVTVTSGTASHTSLGTEDWSFVGLGSDDKW